MARRTIETLLTDQTQYTFILIYILCITVVKVSILLFYRRLFDTDRFKRTSAAVVAFVVAYCLTFMIGTIFQCTPVRYMWVKSIDGHCMNTPVFLLVGSILNILTDIVIVILPIPIVWSLQVTRQQKMALSGIFLLGGLCVVNDSTRLHTTKC